MTDLAHLVEQVESHPNMATESKETGIHSLRGQNLAYGSFLVFCLGILLTWVGYGLVVHVVEVFVL